MNNDSRYNKSMRRSSKKKNKNEMPYIIEIDTLCNILNIGKNTAYNLLTSGEIDSFKIGSVWKIPIESVNDYIDRKCEEQAPRKLLYRVVSNRENL